MEVDQPGSPAPVQPPAAPKQVSSKDEELKDKFCDPTSPVTVQFNEVTMAAYKIRGGIERTPCTVSYCCCFFAGSLKSQLSHLLLPGATVFVGIGAGRHKPVNFPNLLML